MQTIRKEGLHSKELLIYFNVLVEHRKKKYSPIVSSKPYPGVGKAHLLFQEQTHTHYQLHMIKFKQLPLLPPCWYIIFIRSLLSTHSHIVYIKNLNNIYKTSVLY